MNKLACAGACVLLGLSIGTCHGEESEAYQAVLAWCQPRYDSGPPESATKRVETVLRAKREDVPNAFRKIAEEKTLSISVRANAIAGVDEFGKSEGRQVQEDILNNFVEELDAGNRPDVKLLYATVHEISDWDDEPMRAVDLLLRIHKASERLAHKDQFRVVPHANSKIDIIFTFVTGSPAAQIAMECNIREGKVKAVPALVCVLGKGPLEKTSNGGFCRAVRLLGDLRAPEAGEELCKHIDFLPDDLLEGAPKDADVEDAKYIAAVALVNIGPPVREAVQKLAGDKDESDTRRALARWVLKKIDGANAKQDGGE